MAEAGQGDGKGTAEAGHEQGKARPDREYSNHPRAIRSRVEGKRRRELRALQRLEAEKMAADPESDLPQAPRSQESVIRALWGIVRDPSNGGTARVAAARAVHELLGKVGPTLNDRLPALESSLPPDANAVRVRRRPQPSAAELPDVAPSTETAPDDTED